MRTKASRSWSNTVKKSGKSVSVLRKPTYLFHFNGQFLATLLSKSLTIHIYSTLMSLQAYLCTIKVYLVDCRCRHKTFADFFGEESPRCLARCDVCTDERAVRRALEQHSRRAMSARLTGGGLVVSEDPSELYGEGRYGQKR